jgi:hypothetical protein
MNEKNWYFKEINKFMKRILFSIILSMGIMLSTTAGTTLAAETKAPGNTNSEVVVGPYEGVFYGIVNGDNDSQAVLALLLTDRDGVVEGKVYLGRGLYVDAGVCGGTEIPPMQQYARGRTLPNDPTRMSVNTNMSVSGFEIGVDLNSQVSTDGKTLTAKATIDLPWLCGRDPSFSGTLERIGN